MRDELILAAAYDIEAALRQVAASNLIVAQAILLTAKDVPMEDWRTINTSIHEMNRELNQQ